MAPQHAEIGANRAPRGEADRADRQAPAQESQRHRADLADREFADYGMAGPDQRGRREQQDRPVPQASDRLRHHDALAQQPALPGEGGRLSGRPGRAQWLRLARRAKL